MILHEQFRELRVAYMEVQTAPKQRTAAETEVALDALAQNHAYRVSEDGIGAVCNEEGVPIAFCSPEAALDLLDMDKEPAPWLNFYYVGKPAEHSEHWWQACREDAAQMRAESSIICGRTKHGAVEVIRGALPGAIRLELFGSPYPAGLPRGDLKTVH